MPHNLFAAAPIASATFLELIQELTIGQRTADTPVRLHNFLHNRIFPKIGDFAIQLYLTCETSPAELKPPAGATPPLRARIPVSMPLGEALHADTFTTRHPTIIQTRDRQPEWLRRTDNATHLIAPIIDQNCTVGALYIGSAKACSFSDEQLAGLMTLCSVIGSRLKSMDTISQLKDSMLALRHSEQIRATLFQISEQAHHFDSVQDFYTKLHATIGKQVHAANFRIMTWQEEDGVLRYTFPYIADASCPHSPGQWTEYSKSHKDFSFLLFSKRSPLLLGPDNIDEIINTHGIRLAGPQPVSWLGVQFHRNNISGALILQSFTDIVYSDHDVRFLSFVARYVGDVLAREEHINQLREAKEHAEQAERNKSAFLATMSHEIRTPMNGIIGMTDLALAKSRQKDIRAYLGMVKTSANRLLALINDILDFSKIEAGKLDLISAPFDIQKEIMDTLALMKVGSEEKQLELSFSWDENIPKIVLGDATRLCQVITNLLSNSIKFTDSGQVRLSVRRAEGDPLSPERIKLEFEVRDTGVGIPADKLDHLFRPFSQVGTTRDCSKPGTGLGLVIVTELVEKMAGNIHVTSTPGKETIFRFSAQFGLPASPAMSLIPRNQPHSPSPKPMEPRKVLVAEDEHINRMIATTVLERAGWQVTAVEDGLEAVELIRTKAREFDLVLMDIQMPRMDGFQATRHIRKLEQLSGTHLPVIAMTAYAVKGDRERCLAAGMDGYIPKPIKPDMLYDEIEAILLPMARKQGRIALQELS